jgi:translation initiation factor eIF-2B subunit alpha
VNEDDREILYNLFRNHLHVLGTSQTTQMALDAFVASLKQLKCPKEDIQQQISDLAETIKDSKPRIAPLINLIGFCEQEFEKQKIFERNTAHEIKSAATTIIADQILRMKQSLKKLIDLGVKYVENGDFIIIHSFSGPILEMLSQAKQQGKDFRALVLRQAFIKTKQVIKYMARRGVPYIVIPEYNLSHFVDKATKLFLGAIGISADGKALCSMGSISIVSIAHIKKLPVYLFVNSLKFSSEKGTDEHIYQKEEILCHDGVEYTQISHSHEILHLDLITHLITEEGEIDKTQLSKQHGDLWRPWAPGDLRP